MTKWVGKIDSCQVCKGSYGDTMYDARIGLQWGNICQSCFDKFGCKLGTGNGQKYTRQEDNSWLLTEGGIT